MRNLLQELLKKHDGVRYPTILGLREHIFTGRYRSSASFLNDVSKFVMNTILNDVPGFFQCFVFSVVYVKSGEQFCHHWTEIVG